MRNNLLSCVNLSINIWKNNIFTSLFPFLIVSNILISYGINDLISEIFKPVMRLFRTNSKCASVFVLSILSGFPGSSIYCKRLLDSKEIDEDDASKVLTFSHFSNPLFILNNISLILNNNIAYMILFIHYFTNIIIAFLFRNYCPKKDNSKIKIRLKIKDNKIGNVLASSINNTISTLLTILGTVTVFLCLSTIIINLFKLDGISKVLVSGIFEITQGLVLLNKISISLKIKSIIAIMFLSFGGISIHVQMISILSETKIRYYPYLLARIIHSIVSGLLVYFFYDFLI